MIWIKDACIKTEYCICKKCLKEFEESVNNMDKEIEVLVNEE